MTDLPKSASLPVATVQNAKEMIKNGTWDFDFIFFTESDQILIIRQHEALYAHLREYPRRMIIPHRLIPYPLDVLKFKHEREPTSHRTPFDWIDKSCCMPRQNCKRRDNWKSVADRSVPSVNIYGLEVMFLLI